MKRSTVQWGWLLAALGATMIWGGLHWFYRLPSFPGEPTDEFVFVGGGPVQGAIPSIHRPTFESVAAADQYLNDGGEGLDVEVGGERRFYPYQIMVWHEAVNDAFGDTPVLVSYSPLTGTGMAFDRRADGTELIFSVSGELWNNGTVFTDEQTGSKWIQLSGLAARGERSGELLAPIPARVMTWSAWKKAYPRGKVLSRETGVTRDYTRNPYGNYAETPTVLFPLNRYDARLEAKTPVYAVGIEGTWTAYPEESLRRIGAVREAIGGVSAEIVFDEDVGAAYAYRLDADGERGEELAITRGYWFAFAAAYPGIGVYELP
jgi:hypothetical protein